MQPITNWNAPAKPGHIIAGQYITLADSSFNMKGALMELYDNGFKDSKTLKNMGTAALVTARAIRSMMS